MNKEIAQFLTAALYFAQDGNNSRLTQLLTAALAEAQHPIEQKIRRSAARTRLAAAVKGQRSPGRIGQRHAPA